MKLKDKRWFKLITNKFFIVTVIFVVWFLFFDTNSWLRHQELNENLNEAKDAKEYYEKEIEADKAQYEALSKDSLELEKYAREEYYMKKDNEDVFIPVIEEKEEE